VRRAAVSAVDLAILFLAWAVDLVVAAADAVAVGVASVLSWQLHRVITYARNPNLRWVRRPGAFAVKAVVAAGAVRVVAYRGVLGLDVRRNQGQRLERPPAPGEVRLTVVVPAKDEAARIGTSVRRLREELADLDPEILVVDDGSSDATTAAAEAAGARVLAHARNRGKGAAVRTGMLAARGRTVAFLDADLAYPPSQARVLLDAIEQGWDVAIGNRFDRRSVVEGKSRLRFLFGRLFNAVTSAVVLRQYQDTQCGCKAFRSDVARSLFGRTRLDGFAFDVEVLHLVEHDRLSLVEVPVTLHEIHGTTVDLRSTVRALADLVRVRRWSRRGVYEESTA
jgi:dolichyl-phosphate beta-glucosyltransferase